jgi:hypothetical protein
MNAKIYRFPERRTLFKGYKIPLYTEDEILLTVIALNIFGNLPEKVTDKTLETYDPVTVIKALVEAKSSTLLSNKSKQIIADILKSIETL